MRIGISGAQSVGKTTLLNALRSEKCFANYNIRNEVTRTVKSYGININEAGSDASQLLIMKEHVYNVYMHDNMLTDRTALDGIVYTHWLYRENCQISEACFDECESIFTKLIGSYDHLFYKVDVVLLLLRCVDHHLNHEGLHYPFHA
ncbi:hypothetical protein EBU71_19480 [bacterium]|nr:hypothetical protein [Candidatus Elulimicrobium humile]